MSGFKVRYVDEGPLPHSEFRTIYGDEPNALVDGAIYQVEREEVHGFYTLFYLRGIPGKFNSVLFEKEPSDAG